ncbi:hypothetical protein MRX96_041125 [Rhipicephalus microplus]
MAAATGDSSHEGTSPLLATSQKMKMESLRRPYLLESAEVHTGTSRVDKDKKAPDNVSHSSQPAERDHKRWEWKSLKELSTLSCEQLQQLSTQLSQLIKLYFYFISERSTDLAPLLEEHHNLQEEIDARNVVIQQLLKLTCQQMELPRRPIQMSVIFPESNSDEEESDAALYN